MNKRNLIVCFLFVIIFVSGCEKQEIVFEDSKDDIKETDKSIDYSDLYNDYVKVLKDKKILVLEDNSYNEIGTVYENYLLELEKTESIKDGYFKIKGLDYYVGYDNLLKINEIKRDDFYKNYILFNESIKTDDKTRFYLNNNIVFELNLGITLPILIKDDDYYGVLYNNNLFYIKKDECSIIKSNNTDLKHTTAISALVYHATYDHNNIEEKNKCIKNNATICLSDIQFDSQMKYLKDNNYLTATMNDLEMFIDGKVNLPKNTVLITIDDGYFSDAAVKIIEKYDLHATIFLIGELANLDEWKTDSWYSKNIELHSHTYNMHNPGKCSGGQGSILKCGDKNMLLEDLKKSREQLKGSTVFCYPFFEYNDYAINILKEAGFTMAFAGGRQKIKVGSNKMTLPRFGVINTTTLEAFKSTIS